jgi:hypothetical protein
MTTPTLCGRTIKRTGQPCPNKVTPGKDACKYHLTTEEREDAPKPKRTRHRRLSPHELEKAVNGTKHAAPKAATTPVHPDDAQIVLAAMRMYADRVTALVDQLSRNLDSQGKTS